MEFKTRLIKATRFLSKQTVSYANEKHGRPLGKFVFRFFTTFSFLFLYNLGCSVVPTGKTSAEDKTLTTLNQANCIEPRAALDIGSGSTKILVADVNFCLQKIVKIHFQDAKSIKVKESLNPKTNAIPKTILTSLVTQIQTWKEQVKHLNVQSYKAVATEVFRKASNGTAFIQEVSKSVHLPIQIIDQKQEAELGFLSALSMSPFTTNDLVVWDIGGGSMQITSYNSAEKRFDIYKGQLASVSFKDEVLKLKANPTKLHSPNPVGKEIAQNALIEAQNHAQKDVPVAIKNELRKKMVVGIGGVHEKSILKQVQSFETKNSKKSFYSPQSLSTTLNQQVHLSDADIKSDYPETEVTNLILVLGFMEGLSISKVDVISANLTQGLIVTR